MEVQFDTSKSLQELENDDWGEPPPDEARSSLVQRVYNLRRVPLRDISALDLTTLIGQQLSLKYVVPVAIARLQQDPWGQHEDQFWTGMLLGRVMELGQEFWRDNPDLLSAMQPVLERAFATIDSLGEYDRGEIYDRGEVDEDTPEGMSLVEAMNDFRDRYFL